MFIYIFLESNQILIKDLKKYKSILSLSFKKDDFYFSKVLDILKVNHLFDPFFLSKLSKLFQKNFFTEVSFK